MTNKIEKLDTRITSHHDRAFSLHEKKINEIIDVINEAVPNETATIENSEATKEQNEEQELLIKKMDETIDILNKIILTCLQNGHWYLVKFFDGGVIVMQFNKYDNSNELCCYHAIVIESTGEEHNIGEYFSNITYFTAYIKSIQKLI
jgi:hypothetical protein